MTRRYARVKHGAPIVARVAKVEGAKLGGTGGRIGVDALLVTAVDGSEVRLTGGYDVTDMSRAWVGGVADASQELILLTWPLLLVKGAELVLDRGMVFDAAVRSRTKITVQARVQSPAKIQPTASPALEAQVLYGDITLGGNPSRLPISVRRCGETLSVVKVVTVNGQDIEPVRVKLNDVLSEGGGCTSAEGRVKIGRLREYFVRGINRFEIEAGTARTEIILDVEF